MGNATPKKILRDVLPAEAHDTAVYPSVANLLDVEVAEVHDGCHWAHRWPGPQQNVLNWWTLANGKRVGWNENPATGWSFPVLGKARTK